MSFILYGFSVNRFKQPELCFRETEVFLVWINPLINLEICTHFLSFQVQVGNFRRIIAKVQLGGSELAIVVSIVVCCVLLLLCTVGKSCCGWWMCICCGDGHSRCEINGIQGSQLPALASTLLKAQRPQCSFQWRLHLCALPSSYLG